MPLADRIIVFIIIYISCFIFVNKNKTCIKLLPSGWVIVEKNIGKQAGESGKGEKVMCELHDWGNARANGNARMKRGDEWDGRRAAGYRGTRARNGKLRQF